jgi:copper homeostasis protein CutC
MGRAIPKVPCEYSAYRGQGKTKMEKSNQVTEADILSLAREIVEAQRKAGLTPSWGTKQHIGLLARVHDRLCAAKANRLDVCKTLDTKGLGGNASQFRQWLNSAKGIGEGTFPVNADVASYA